MINLSVDIKDNINIINKISGFQNQIKDGIIHYDNIETEIRNANFTRFDEIFNLRVNGKNVLPRRGNDKAPNQRLAMLVDAYGDRGAYYGSNIIQNDDIAGRVGGGANKQGRQDYFGVMVMNNISDLQLNYSRTVPTNDGSTATALSIYPMNLHLFGECVKQIQIGKGTYNVSYM